MADEVEIKDLTADAAPASTDEMAKQAAAGGAGSTKKSTVAQIVAAAAPQAHAASHINGSDGIQDATAAQKGVATAAQITKLDGIETAATADQTGAEIKTAYEGEADTNAFTDVEKNKLAGIEALADVNDVDSVFGRTGAVVAVSGDYDHSEVGNVGFDDHKTVTTTNTTDGTATTIETIAIADDTVVEIVADIVGRRTDAADRIGGIIRATVYREAAAGVVVEGTSKDFAASDAQYDLNVVGSGNNALIQVTGRAAHSLNWRSVSTVNKVS